jgi:short-subunit dehydrogenase
MSASPPWKTALVTGASSGLGRGLALWLARRGVQVYAAARRKELLESLRAEAGGNVVPVQLDVSDGAKTFDAVGKLDAEVGGLDLVIANAGVGEETVPKRLKWETIQRMLDVNVSGATATLTGALPGMIERRRGHVVGIASLAGLIHLPRNATYCATKSYVHMFCSALRLDLERYGVDVTCVYPGFVKTAMTQKNDPKGMPFLLELDDATERMGKALLKRQRDFAFPWQLASAITFGRSLPRAVQTPILRKLR